MNQKNNEMKKLENLLGRVPREVLERFVLEQGRENAEFAYALRSWLKRGYALPEEKGEAYLPGAVQEAVERTIELCRSGCCRGGEAAEWEFPMPVLLDEVEQAFRRGHGACVVWVALAFFRQLVRSDGLKPHFEVFYHFVHDFDRLVALLPEVLQHPDTPADAVRAVLSELIPLCKRRFYKKHVPLYDLGALKLRVAETVGN